MKKGLKRELKRKKYFKGGNSRDGAQERELKLLSSGEKAQKRENWKKAQERQVGGAMPCRGLFNYNYKCSSSHATTVKELIFSEIVKSKSQSHNYCPKSNGHDHLDPGENMIQQSNITSKKSVFVKVWLIKCFFGNMQVRSFNQGFFD